GGGHGGGVELDQPGERCVGKHRLVVDVLHRALGPDDAGPYARGADVDDEHAHRQPAPAPTVTALLPGRPAPTVTALLSGEPVPTVRSRPCRWTERVGQSQLARVEDAL